MHLCESINKNESNFNQICPIVGMELRFVYTPLGSAFRYLRLQWKEKIIQTGQLLSKK